MTDRDKMFLVADVQVIDEPSEELIAKAGEVRGLSLPNGLEKQPDLLYTKSIFVSTGPNKNGAYFIPSELVRAKDSIVNKAMDIEHDQQHIVGHIIDYVFQKTDGTPFDAEAELASMGEQKFNETKFDIAVLSVMHRMRFPDVADDILKGTYNVSMETLYADFDVQIGNIIMSKEEALANNIVNMVGKHVKVVYNNDSVIDGRVKVLKRFKGMHFSGCGYVRKPANPRSVILEAASQINDEFELGSQIPVIDVKNITAFNKLVEEKGLNKIEQIKVEDASLSSVDEPEEGLCVSYKRRVYDREQEEAGAQVVRENYCALFEDDCTVAGAAVSPGCLRNVFNRETIDTITNKFDKLWAERDRKFLTSMGLEIPPELDSDNNIRLHKPGLDYDINEINREIRSRNEGVTVENLINDSQNLLASLDKSIAKANEILKASKTIKSFKVK